MGQLMIDPVLTNTLNVSLVIIDMPLTTICHKEQGWLLHPVHISWNSSWITLLKAMECLPACRATLTTRRHSWILSRPEMRIALVFEYGNGFTDQEFPYAKPAVILTPTTCFDSTHRDGRLFPERHVIDCDESCIH